MLLLVASMALTQGCAEYELHMKDSTPKRDLVYPETNDTCLCLVKRNYLYDLASVVTLGIWMPLEITYRCQSEKKGRGKLPGQ